MFVQVHVYIQYMYMYIVCDILQHPFYMSPVQDTLYEREGLAEDKKDM